MPKGVTKLMKSIRNKTFSPMKRYEAQPKAPIASPARPARLREESAGEMNRAMAAGEPWNERSRGGRLVNTRTHRADGMPGGAATTVPGVEARAEKDDKRKYGKSPRARAAKRMTEQY